MIELVDLGWNTFFEDSFKTFNLPEMIPGRVTLEEKHRYQILTTHGELKAEVTGKICYNATSRHDFPAVGDWVILEPRLEERRATIHNILARKSTFSRKAAGNLTEEQILGTNIDTVFLVNALNNDFNLRRIERYLTLAWSSGANPVMVLSKADLCEDIEEKVMEVESVALGVPIFVVSSLKNEGLDALRPYLYQGQTIALLGSSGVGKSTLINLLLQKEVQKVQDIREDDHKGKHTTTSRQLIPIEGGGLIMDSPGMRELQLWDSTEGFEETFEDIEDFASRCQFRDCLHENEPQCGIQMALADGTLEEKRYFSYQKLQRELAFLERKQDVQAKLAEKKKWKKITSDIKKKNKKRY